MRRVVCLSYVPLNETLLRLFPLEPARSEGLPAEYWDLSPLFAYAHAHSPPHSPFVRQFASWGSVEATLLGAESEETLVFSALPDEPRFFRLRRLMARSRATLAGIITGVLPMPAPGSPGFLRRKALQLANPAKAARFALKRAQALLAKAGLTRGYDLVFAAGTAAREQAGRAPVVPINMQDYDDWLRFRDTDERPITGPYAVYLDQFATAHPDLEFIGIKNSVDPERYYALLDAFFSRVEREMALEVVIAAHPKSDYPVNPFRRRRILRGSTRQLVRHCELAMATHSTSMSFAVLGRKPLVFFTTDDLRACYRAAGLDALPAHFASVLGMPCLSLDRLPAGRLERRPVDEALYADYERRYLVSPETAGRTSEEVYRTFFQTRRIGSVGPSNAYKL